jgi:hypothetical protein
MSIYIFPGSPHTGFVVSVAKYLDIPLEHIIVDLNKGE